MSVPSFWKWSEWSEYWPRVPAGPVPVFDISGTSDEFQSSWNTTARLLAICNGAPGFYEPVSVIQARRVAEAMDAWVASPVFADLMTLPPTRKGFRAALAVELRRPKPSPVAFVLALTRPADTAAVLDSQSSGRLSPDWQIIKACIHQPPVDAPTSVAASAPSPDSAGDSALAPQARDAHPRLEPPASAVPPRAAVPPPHASASASVHPSAPSLSAAPSRYSDSPSDKTDRIPTTSKAPPIPSAAVQNCAQAMMSWVENSVGQNISVAREEIAREIKESALLTKGAGQAALNYWFEDVGFPALCTLPPEAAKSLVDLWPESAACTFNDPVRSMDNLNFWRAIRFTASKAMRVFIVDEALPKILRSDWDPATRLAMLDPMTAAAREPSRGWLFEERLRLWTALGGRLDAPVALDPEPGASLLAGGPRSTSARRWLEEQNRPNWTAVLSREPYAVRPSDPEALTVLPATLSSAPFDLPDSPESAPRRPRGP